MMNKFGNWLRSMRVERGITLVGFGRGIQEVGGYGGASYWSKVERGEIVPVDVGPVGKVLGVDPREVKEWYSVCFGRIPERVMKRVEAEDLEVVMKVLSGDPRTAEMDGVIRKLFPLA